MTGVWKRGQRDGKRRQAAERTELVANREAPKACTKYQRGTPPGVLYGCEYKGFTGKLICKVMKTKDGRKWVVSSEPWDRG
jgi:hypothetical protein